MDKVRCKEELYGNWRNWQCLRKAVRDGYCKQHHPDSVKAREKAIAERYEIKRKRSPWYRLGEAEKKIKELEKEIGRLKAIIGERYVGT